MDQWIGESLLDTCVCTIRLSGILGGKLKDEGERAHMDTISKHAHFDIIKIVGRRAYIVDKLLVPW